ncbi:MAG: nitroreductase family protein [Thermoguttaceae bacterium]|nr:nitroreductase family protein [Thermoguttaceae bacterium]
MDAYENLLTRRSVRRFEKTPIAEETLEKILKAGMYAPSACNCQPWEFIILDDPAIVSEIPKINPHAAMALQAPLSILVCGDLQREHPSGYWVVDCAAAVQNIMLAAHALGVGSVWTAVYPRPERVAGFKTLLNLPEHIVPHALDVVGYAAEQPTPPNRFVPTRIHHNAF